MRGIALDAARLEPSVHVRDIPRASHAARSAPKAPITPITPTLIALSPGHECRSKLLGRSGEVQNLAPLTPPTHGRRTSIAVVSDQLTVTFHAHDVAGNHNAHFLTAVSEGLLERRQRELVVALPYADRG